MRLKPFNPDKELKKANRKYTKKQLIITLLVLVVMITIGSSYAIFSIQPEYHTFVKSQVGEFSTGDIKLSVLVEGVTQSDFPAKGTGYVFDKVECENGSTGTWNANTWQLTLASKGPDKCTVSFVKEKVLQIIPINSYYYEGEYDALLIDATGVEITAIPVGELIFYDLLYTPEDEIYDEEAYRIKNEMEEQLRHAETLYELTPDLEASILEIEAEFGASVKDLRLINEFYIATYNPEFEEYISSGGNTITLSLGKIDYYDTVLCLEYDNGSWNMINNIYVEDDIVYLTLESINDGYIFIGVNLNW